MCAALETQFKIVFQEKPVCEGFINIGTDSNNKLYVDFILSDFNLFFLNMSLLSWGNTLGMGKILIQQLNDT